MGRWNDLKGILSAAARLSSVTADACDLVTAARRLRSAPPRVCPHRQPSAARSDARAAPTQACTVNHRRIEHRSMVTPAASEVETRLSASPLQLWASPAQAKRLCYKSGGVSTRRALTYLGSHLVARESRPNRLAAAAADVAGLQAGLWPALGKLWRGAGAALVTNSACESDFFRESEKGQLGVRRCRCNPRLP